MSYEQLLQLPLLNGVTIIGDRRLEDFGLIPMSAEDISSLMIEVFGYLL